MYIFGHLGVGPFIARSLVSRTHLNCCVPKESQTYLFGWLLIGCLLPDLIDKSLFLFKVRYEMPLPMIVGGKTITHTICFPIVAYLIARWKKTSVGQIVAIGIASHLILDFSADSMVWLWSSKQPHSIPPYSFSSPKLAGYLWPLMGTEFVPSYQKSIGDYWSTLWHPVLMFWEIVGLCLFIRTSYQNRFNPFRWPLTLYRQIFRTRH